MYRDYQCAIGGMSNPDPKCNYVTLEEMRLVKRRKVDATTEEIRNKIFQDISKHDIRNALTKSNLPLSDQIQRNSCMTPPELVHTSGSGLIMYMFQTLQLLLLPAFQIVFNALHQKLSTDIGIQSEEDFLAGRI